MGRLPQHGLHRLPHIEEMRTKPQFVRVSAAGMRESHVHDVQITKEAPNYPRELTEAPASQRRRSGRPP
jgi:hypothetical protein